MKYFIILFCIGIIGLISCGKDELNPQEQLDKDILLIEKYLKDHNLTAEKTAHGIYYILEQPGGDEKPKLTNTVVANYKGYFVDDVVFDAATKASFPLYNVIQGWQIGIPKFGIGGKGKLFIPSKYGYGASKVKDRANAVLIFDIELLDIQ